VVWLGGDSGGGCTELDAGGDRGWIGCCVCWGMLSSGPADHSGTAGCGEPSHMRALCFTRMHTRVDVRWWRRVTGTATDCDRQAAASCVTQEVVCGWVGGCVGGWVGGRVSAWMGWVSGSGRMEKRRGTLRDSWAT
jgi:hypothetical protein